MMEFNISTVLVGGAPVPKNLSHLQTEFIKTFPNMGLKFLDNSYESV